MNRFICLVILASTTIWSMQGQSVRAQLVPHSDVLFTYGTSKIEIATQQGRTVIPQTFPDTGFFAQANSNPGFFSESDVGGGTGPNDILAYNVLDELVYWSEGEFSPVMPETQIRIVNNPTSVEHTIVGAGTGVQRASFSPLRNSIGQSNGAGEFHAHVDFRIEPLSSDPELTPATGVYGLKLSLSSENPSVEESDPFFIVFRFGIEETAFAEALNDFDALLWPSSLLGDFTRNGVLDAGDIDLLSLEVGNNSNAAKYDVTGDGIVDQFDRSMWVEDLAGTFFGDTDLNGSVEFADFLSLSSRFGSLAGWAAGDFDGNGSVEFADFLSLSSNYGKEGHHSAATVPEPRFSAVCGLVGSLAGMALLRPRRRVVKRYPRRGFTLVELLVVLAIIAMLVSLLLPAVQAARSAARKTQCVNNLRQLALGFHAHHDAIGYFPLSQLGSGEPDGHGACKGGMFSWHARILPYIEETALFESIEFAANMSDSCTSGEDGTISQLHPNGVAAATVVPVFLCPADGVTGMNQVVMGSANPASDNYAANAGWPTASSGIDGQWDAPLKYNGLVSLTNPRKSDLSTLAKIPVRIRSVTDGLSKTAALTERLIQTATERSAILEGDARLQSFHLTTTGRALEQMADRCSARSTHADAQHSAYLGRAWISGWSPTGATYRHLKSPNTTNCHFSDSFTSGEFIVTPSSEHSGGVNVAMADGRVQFVANDVDDRVWWAYGSRNDGDALK